MTVQAGLCRTWSETQIVGFSHAQAHMLFQNEGLPDQVPKMTEAQRRLEQLILYVRSLHLLSSALQLARDELKAGRLTISNSLKTGKKFTLFSGGQHS